MKIAFRTAGPTLAAGLIFSACAVLSQQPSTLQATLDRLDAASKNFVNFQADLEQDDFTRLVKQTETSHGMEYAIRGKSGTEVGIKVGPRTVLYQKGVAKDYDTGIACYNSYSADKNKGTFDTLLTLAFGTSGKDLADHWDIKDLGPTTLTVDNKPTRLEMLELTPRDAGLKNNITRVTLWADLDKDYSPKVVIVSPSGDTHTAIYSNIRLNAKTVNTKPFEIKGKPCK